MKYSTFYFSLFQNIHQMVHADGNLLDNLIILLQLPLNVTQEHLKKNLLKNHNNVE